MKIRWDEADGSGVNVGFHLDEASNRITVLHSQPIDAIVKQNHWRRQNEDNTRLRKSGALYEVADVPNIIAMEWMKLYGVNIMDKDHMPAVLALIDSPEWHDAVATTNLKVSRRAPRKHLTGVRDRANHPLASNRSYQHTSGGLIDSGAWRG